jgi:hypothetical protein
MPSFIRLRLGFLLSAILIGMLGMARNDSRLVYAGIGLGVIGLVFRFFKPKPNAEDTRGPER